jgi:hypothetical protein
MRQIDLAPSAEKVAATMLSVSPIKEYRRSVATVTTISRDFKIRILGTAICVFRPDTFATTWQEIESSSLRASCPFRKGPSRFWDEMKCMRSPVQDLFDDPAVEHRRTPLTIRKCRTTEFSILSGFFSRYEGFCVPSFMGTMIFSRSTEPTTQVAVRDAADEIWIDGRVRKSILTSITEH